MARRVGIELSPSRCAIVDIDVPADRSRHPARIRTFRTIPWSPTNTEPLVETLRTLRASNLVPDRADVALWGVRSTSHVMTLAPGQDADPRAVAPPGGMWPAAEGDTTSAVLFDDPTSQVRLQVGHDHHLPVEKLFRLVGLGDTGENGARLRFADIDFQVQQLVRALHRFGGHH